MVLASFPVPVPAVLKKMIPVDASVDEPLILQYFMRSLDASLINRIVEVPADEEVLVFDMVRSLAEPTAFTLPSMVTLSAPFRSMRGVSRLPVILSPVTVG